AEHVEGFKGPVTVTQFQGGQSNPTYRLSTPGREYVLRRKPPGKLLPSAHAVDREYRIITALGRTRVPVPRTFALCEDDRVIGTAFFIMEWVEGRVMADPLLPGLTPSERSRIYDSMNEVLATLHSVDLEAAGLTDYGRPGSYFGRQIDRWTRQYRASETERIEAMERLIEWLPSQVPREADPPTRIVHGDFCLDNVIFHPTEPRILAVIDWELATLGHPLADFAYHAMSWSVGPEHNRGMAGCDLDALGIPNAEAYWSTYLQRTGMTVAADRRFYLISNLFRSVGILQGIAKRVQEGTAASARAAEVARSARPLAELAWRLAQEM